MGVIPLEQESLRPIGWRGVDLLDSNDEAEKIPILCLLAGPEPLSEDPNDQEFSTLSKYFQGFILSPVWEGGEAAVPGQPRARLGRFEYYTKYTLDYFAPLRVLINLAFYVQKGRSLYRQTPYRAIVAYGPFTTAWAGWLLKKFTGARLVVEFPGNPLNSFLLNAAKPTLIARCTAPLAVRMADHVRLLYPEQLEGVANVAPAKCSAFHYFTAIESIEPADTCDDYILALGGPWYRKGIDVLIRAFLQICDEFPETELRVVGFSHDQEYYQGLSAGHPRIKLCKPVPHNEAIELVRRCRIFACPSRSEGFPRVIIEAMAAARPVVASAVDGIPTYIRDDANGLLIPSDDVPALAGKLALVLRDGELAQRLGTQAREDALAKLTESDYADYYREMVNRAMGRAGRAAVERNAKAVPSSV
jgi:glycosyltransferase involved in cell wall biosynthesis